MKEEQQQKRKNKVKCKKVIKKEVIKDISNGVR